MRNLQIFFLALFDGLALANRSPVVFGGREEDRGSWGWAYNSSKRMW